MATPSTCITGPGHERGDGDRKHHATARFARSAWRRVACTETRYPKRRSRAPRVVARLRRSRGPGGGWHLTPHRALRAGLGRLRSRRPGQQRVLHRAGGVKLSVLSRRGREAIVAMLAPGDFFGEGCLAGQPLRMCAATALVPTSVLRIHKRAMTRSLHEQSAALDDSSRTCWFATSGLRRTSLITCSIRARSGWRERCSSCPLRRRTHATTRAAENLAGDARRDGRHDSIARQRLLKSSENWDTSRTTARSG